MVERYRPKDYVGYGHTPRHTRFKKGQSGYPPGRPRKPVTATSIVAKELQSTVHITENGQRLKIDKLSLLIKQVFNRAISGRHQPLTQMMKLLDTFDRILNTATAKASTTIDDIDIRKLSLDEKIKKLKEVIANSKTVDEYQ